MVDTMHSDAEDDRTVEASDEDVLREEEDMENLIAGSSKAAGLNSLFSKGPRDPNLPRPAKPSRREVRKKRRRDKRGKRGQRDGREDETSLMYEMEGGVKSASSDDSMSVSSEERFSEKRPSRRTRRIKFLHFTVIPAVIALMACLLIYGTYVMSNKRKATPAAAKVLRSNGTSLFAPTTILISLDGFRADFLDRGLTPTLSAFVKQGVSPKYLLPSFPSVTFPNHWTMATGLYPESHGVVGNSFWDPDTEKEFWYTDPARSMQVEWWTSTGAEPIWSTAEMQGVRSAVHMWPGSEAGVLPQATYLDKYNGSETLARKVNTVLGLLDRPSEFDSDTVAYDEARPHLIAYYVPNVDAAGHLYGPNSTEIRETISAVDTSLHDLFEGLEQRNLTSIVNIVVVSDHGMATTSIDRLVQLEDLVDPADLAHIDGWPLYGLRLKEGVDLMSMYNKLRDAAATTYPQLDVYLRSNMPERWHFNASDRIAPLWIIPHAGWAIVQRKDFDVAEARLSGGAIYHPRGLHGYDHEHPLMRAIFVARGPAFPHEPNSRLEVFQNTEIYNIVCDSLGIEPKPNNGTLRLPLQPVGSHSDEDSYGGPEWDGGPEGESEPIVDFPASSPTTTPIIPVESSPPAQDIGEHEDSWSFWDAWAAAKQKLKEYLDRVSAWIHGNPQHGSEEGESNDGAAAAVVAPSL